MRTEISVVERRVVLVVDQLTRRVFRRCRELGINVTEVARRMGVARCTIALRIRRENLSEAYFKRLSAALEMAPEDWAVPLPPPRQRSAPLYERLQAQGAERRARLLRAGQREP